MARQVAFEMQTIAITVFEKQTFNGMFRSPGFVVVGFSHLYTYVKLVYSVQ